MKYSLRFLEVINTAYTVILTNSFESLLSFHVFDMCFSI